MRSEKQLLLDEIRDKISGAGGLFLTRYQGLGAGPAEAIRTSLRNAGGEMEVVRKRILLKAAAEAGVEIQPELLEGHIAIVFSGADVVQTAKILVDFGKENGESVEVLAAQLDGQQYDAQSVKKLSKMPGIQELRAQFVGLLAAPMTQTVGTMQAVLTSLLYLLENRREAITE